MLFLLLLSVISVSVLFRKSKNKNSRTNILNYWWCSNSLFDVLLKENLIAYAMYSSKISHSVFYLYKTINTYISLFVQVQFTLCIPHCQIYTSIPYEPPFLTRFLYYSVIWISGIQFVCYIVVFILNSSLSWQISLVTLYLVVDMVSYI